MKIVDSRDILTFITIGILILVVIIFLHKRSKLSIPIFLFAILYGASIIYANFGIRHPLNERKSEGLYYEEIGEYRKAYDIYTSIYEQMGDWSDIKECIDRVLPYSLKD